MSRHRLALSLAALLAAHTALSAEPPIDVGSRLELFVDDTLIEEIRGDARLQLHKPRGQEVVLVADQPWEGNTCAYYTVFQDGALYRMYYRGSHHDEKTRKPAHRQVTCYAESTDGVRWRKPSLGLFEFEGSKQNNIVWDGIGTHNFTPLKDARPNCPAEARYKALAGGKGGLLALQSADAVHWSLMSDQPVITKGAFDSQNLAFWDPHAEKYREYHRAFRGGVRDIMTGTSGDFLAWSDPVFLEYPGAPKEHLYTNAVAPYERAPHILIGFPTRFLPQRGQQTEPTLMASRDGRTFHRWRDALIAVTAPQDRDGNRCNYMAWGMLKLPGKEKEYSVYATEAYYAGPDSRLRRFTYRVDGFVSVRASAAGGELLSGPLRFRGDRLAINFATSPQGSIRVEIQEADGRPIEGFRLADCVEMRGDALERIVAWQGGADIGKLAEGPIRLRIALRRADLYALQFQRGCVEKPTDSR